MGNPYRNARWWALEGQAAYDRWRALVPEDVALRQTVWEHQRMALRMRVVGLTLREMGIWLHVSTERARVIWCAAKRGKGKRSPVEVYQEQGPLTVLRDG